MLSENEFLEFLVRLSRCVNGSSIKNSVRFSSETCTVGLPFFESKEFEKDKNEGKYFIDLREKLEIDEGTFVKKEKKEK